MLLICRYTYQLESKVKELFFFATKEKEKYIFLFQNISSFSFLYCEKRKENEAKEKNNALFPTTLRLLNKMDVAGKPALSRSLKNARGATVAHF